MLGLFLWSDPAALYNRMWVILHWSNYSSSHSVFYCNFFLGCEWLQHAQFSCVSYYVHFFYFGHVFLTGSEWFYMGPSCVFSDIPSTNLFLLAWQRVSMPADSTVLTLVIYPLTIYWLDREWVILSRSNCVSSYDHFPLSGPTGLTECEWSYMRSGSIFTIVALPTLVLLLWQRVSDPMSLGPAVSLLKILSTTLILLAW